MALEQSPELRRGWNTRTRAAAAARAAFTAILGGSFPNPVAIRLPRRGSTIFLLALAELKGEGAGRGNQRRGSCSCRSLRNPRLGWRPARNVGTCDSRAGAMSL